MTLDEILANIQQNLKYGPESSRNTPPPGANIVPDTYNKVSEIAQGVKKKVGETARGVKANLQYGPENFREGPPREYGIPLPAGGTSMSQDYSNAPTGVTGIMPERRRNRGAEGGWSNEPVITSGLESPSLYPAGFTPPGPTPRTGTATPEKGVFSPSTVFAGAQTEPGHDLRFAQNIGSWLKRRVMGGPEAMPEGYDERGKPVPNYSEDGAPPGHPQSHTPSATAGYTGQIRSPFEMLQSLTEMALGQQRMAMRGAASPGAATPAVPSSMSPAERENYIAKKRSEGGVVKQVTPESTRYVGSAGSYTNDDLATMYGAKSAGGGSYIPDYLIPGSPASVARYGIPDRSGAIEDMLYAQKPTGTPSYDAIQAAKEANFEGIRGEHGAEAAGKLAAIRALDSERFKQANEHYASYAQGLVGNEANRLKGYETAGGVLGKTGEFKTNEALVGKYAADAVKTIRESGIIAPNYETQMQGLYKIAQASHPHNAALVEFLKSPFLGEWVKGYSAMATDPNPERAKAGREGLEWINKMLPSLFSAVGIGGGGTNPQTGQPSAQNIGIPTEGANPQQFSASGFMNNNDWKQPGYTGFTEGAPVSKAELDKNKGGK